MRKRISLFLTAVLLITLLAACGETTSDGKRRDKSEGGKPSATPTPTEVVAPTLPPLPTPEPLPEIIEYGCGEPNRAMVAFADYLDKKLDESVYNVNRDPEIRYDIFFLNTDNAPEFWWAEGNSHADAVHVCMFDGEKIVELGCLGEFGSFQYVENGNAIVVKEEAAGVESTTIYMLTETTLFRAVNLSKQVLAGEKGEETKYFVNEIECSEADYNERVKTWSYVTNAASTVRYSEGLSSVIFYDDDPYPIATCYAPIYAHLTALRPGIFRYDVPDDVLEQLVGTWVMDRGEVEGWEYSAKEEGIKASWILEPNGEAERSFSNGFYAETNMYHMSYMPGRMYLGDTATNIWWLKLPVKDKDEYYYFITINAAGELFEYEYCERDFFAACHWYKKAE